MGGIAKVGTHLHRRFERAGPPRRYCEVEVTKRALSDWVVVVTRGTVGGRAAPKVRQKKFSAGINALAEGEREVARAKAQGYRAARLPKDASTRVAAKKRETPRLEPGLALVDRCVDALATATKVRAKRGDEAALAKVRLARGTKLPPSIARYLGSDLRMARVPGAARKGDLVIDASYTPVPVPPEVAASELLRITHGAKVKRRELRDLGEKKVRGPGALLDTRLRGKLFRLPSTGDQLHFLYAGVADDEGELPILGMELESFETDDGAIAAEVAVFLKYPSFDWMLADLAGLLDPALESSGTRRELAKAMKETRKRHPEIRDQARFDR